jgi:hypothetical protein
MISRRKDRVLPHDRIERLVVGLKVVLAAEMVIRKFRVGQPVNA